MAIMIPENFDPVQTPTSEQLVFAELQKNLSGDWTVLHSLSYTVMNNGQRFDGEVDFVLCHPAWGILLLEVKGGAVQYLNGGWTQNGNVIKNPVKQVLRNKNSLRQLLAERMHDGLNFRMAHAVCFPLVGYHEKWPPEAQDIVLTGDAFFCVEEFAKKLLSEAPLPFPGDEFYPFKDILQSLIPEIRCGSKLFERSQAEGAHFFRLTEQQCQLLEMLENFPHLAVQGVAGSGKTVMAVKKAKRLASAGKNVLLLCYNQILAGELQEAVADFPGIRAAALFDYALELLKIPADTLEKYTKDPDFYPETLPLMLKEYLQNRCLRYDAVIVDEGQDFSKSAWDAISMLLQKESCFYVFYDPDQNIFHKELNVPDFGLPPVMLTRNCRNTRRIIKALHPYQSIPGEPLDDTPEGAELREIHGNCRQNLQDELTRLLKKEKLPLSDVVILGAHSMEHTCIGKNAYVGPYKIVKNTPAAPGTKEVSYYTFMKFKGCEAKVVILLDVDIAESRWADPKSFYVAMSRAVHQLVVLHKH